jgi:hypothetical protein
MPSNTIQDVLLAIHALGNTATDNALWKPVRQNLAGKNADWVAIVDEMERQGLVAVTWSQAKYARKPLTYLLLQAGMDRITASRHVCREPYCRPLAA